jgi:hypothetical protein
VEAPDNRLPDRDGRRLAGRHRRAAESGRPRACYPDRNPPLGDSTDCRCGSARAPAGRQHGRVAAPPCSPSRAEETLSHAGTGEPDGLNDQTVRRWLTIMRGEGPVELIGTSPRSISPRYRRARHGALFPSGGFEGAPSTRERKLNKRCAHRSDGAPRSTKRCFHRSQEVCVRGGVEPPTFRFSGQPRQTLCRPAKTDVTDKRNRARRKVRSSR